MSLAITEMSVSELAMYAGNPRKNEHAVVQVAEAIERFGFRVPVLAKSNGELIDGHLRLKAAKYLGLEKVPAILCDDLSADEVRALRISINRMADLASWDNELLLKELDELVQAGIDIADVGFDRDTLKEIGAELDSDNPYTAKVDTPIYKPKGEKPATTDLYDRCRYDELVRELEASDLPEDVLHFLKLAATRHIVFDYQQIAEFYAHASADVQRLMENSALVIIDYNRAIELGFVKLTERIKEVFEAQDDEE